MKLPKTYNTYFVAIIATVGGMLFGFDISSMSAIIGTKQYIDFFDNPHGVRQGAIGKSLSFPLDPYGRAPIGHRILPPFAYLQIYLSHGKYGPG
jgi:hypothetical protein